MRRTLLFVFALLFLCTMSGFSQVVITDPEEAEGPEASINQYEIYLLLAGIGVGYYFLRRKIYTIPTK